MSKSLRVPALLLVAFSLIAFPAFAGQAPTFSMSVGVPNTRPLTDQDHPGRVLDISKMPVLLDGVALPEGPQAKQALRELYLVVDEELGVIHAFRTLEEFQAHVKTGADCSNPKAVTAAAGPCVFYNGTNCAPPPGGTATRAVAVACGTIVPGITGPTLLNGPIQSFYTGCNGVVLIPNTNCSVPNPQPPPPAPQAVTVTPGGLCINVTNSPYNCAGCLPATTP